MAQEDSNTTAPYDDGFSTESEDYGEDFIELASAENAQFPVKIEPTTEVKVENVDNVDNANARIPESTATEAEDSTTIDTASQTPAKRKRKSYSRCKRCRRKLLEISKDESKAVHEGKMKMQRCACCEVDLPTAKFSSSNRNRAIPRCRKCSQAKPEILSQIRQLPQYAEAVETERQQRKKKQAGKRAELPPFKRMSNKQRWEEQFTIVNGKTARERRLAERIATKKRRIQNSRQQS